MAIPPGQFKYARLKAESEAAADTKTEDNTAEADGSGILVAASSSVTGEAENIAVTENNDDKTINSDNVVNRTSGTTQAEGHDPEQNQAQGVIITEDMQTNGHEPPHDNVECNILPPTAKLEEEDHTWEEKAERAEVVEDMELTGDEISLHSPASNTRCQRCKQRKKSCDKQRPCRRCRDAGIGAEGCIPVVYDVAAATKKRKVHDDDSQAATLNKKSKGNKVESGEKTAENKTPVNLHVKGTDTEAHISVQDKSSATEAPEDTQRQGVALEHSASMSIVRCQRCAKRRIAGCDHKRPCQHCKAAGIGAEGCIPGLDKRSASNRKKGNLPATKKEGSQASPTTKTTRLGTEFSEPETDECVMGNETGASRAPEVAEVQEVQPSSTNEKGTQSLTVVDGREVVLHTITNPSQLEKKIIEVDGRIKVKDLPTFNTWRTSRGLRNNQDLGTLFEMREAFYVYQYPMITRPRKSRKAD